MLQDLAEAIDTEVAEDALAELSSGGYLPGQSVNRRLKLILPCHWDMIFIAATFDAEGYENTIHLQGEPQQQGDPLKIHGWTCKWNHIELDGMIPEDVQPGEYECAEIECQYWGHGPHILCKEDVLSELPDELLDSFWWPRNIRVAELTLE